MHKRSSFPFDVELIPVKIQKTASTTSKEDFIQNTKEKSSLYNASTNLQTSSEARSTDFSDEAGKPLQIKKPVIDVSVMHLEHNETMSKRKEESKPNMLREIKVPLGHRHTSSSTMHSESRDDMEPSKKPCDYAQKPLEAFKEKAISLKNLFEPSQQRDSSEYQKERYSELHEIMKKAIQKDRPCKFYDKPIYKRQNVKPMKENKVVYYCTGCCNVGAAVDFLSPTLCSTECLRKVSNNESLSTQKEVILLNSDCSEVFNWGHYLKSTNSEAAPLHLFDNPYPSGPNSFQLGMKVEAIDPQNQSMFCVCTVVQILGYRIRLHFDSYDSIHDFWVNADSPNIFPPGWCAKTGRILYPPKGYPNTFQWRAYLEKTEGILPHGRLFPHLKESCGNNPFKVGMKLEAADINKNNQLCVATVTDTLNNRVLIHLDDRSRSCDYWVKIDSPNIHPINFHMKTADKQLRKPPSYRKQFSWSHYLFKTQSEAADDSFFSERKPIGFLEAMKVEVVDLKNPTLIRPATIVKVKGCKVKIRFDSWLPEYYFWIADDSPDIHPVGWAENTGHPLEPPISKFSRLIW